MQHVKPKWLHIYQVVLCLLDIVFFVLYFAFDFLEVGQSTVNAWGVTPLVVVIAGIHLGFSLLIYPFIRKKHEWISFAISATISGLLLAAVIATSGNDNLWYRLGLVVATFFINMIGPYLPIAVASLTWIVLIFDIVAIVPDSPVSITYNVLINLLVSAAAIGGWLFFKRFYIKRPDKETLAKLQSEQTKTNFILSSMTDGMVLIGPARNVEYLNPAAEKMLGWPAKNAVGLKSEQVLQFYNQKKQPYTPEQNPLNKSMVSKKPVRDNDVLLGNREGKFLDVSFDAMPLLDENGAATGGMMGIFRDISKEREEERQKAEFISTASHEMRTPVAAIEGYLALALNDKVATTDDRAKNYLKKAHGATQHLGQLFQDLLTSSKVEDGRLSNHPTVIEMGEMLEKLTEDLRFTAHKKGLGIEYVVGAGEQTHDARSNNNKVLRPLYYVYADQDRLREVITNLFDNAVKYTPSGKISIGVTGDDKVVQFYVKDTGAGIPAEDLPHLFQKFYRVDNSETRTVGGTGLGLFICRKILELYRGRIWVTSKVGEGSTFYVNLPRLSSDQATQKTQAQQKTSQDSRDTMLSRT